MNRIFLFVALITILGCSSKEESRVEQMSMGAYTASHVVSQDAPASAMMEFTEPNIVYNPKLIKRGSFTILSNDIEKTKNVLYGLVKQCQGYVEKEEVTNRESQSFCHLTFNIKASEFDKFISLTDSVELNIINKSFSVDDITTQYIDDSTRLENKRKLERRYLELLNKTSSMKEILEIEEKLEGLRSDIESRQNQLKVLDKQIAYSSFNVTIETEQLNHTYDKRNRYSNKFIQGLIDGWEGVKSVSIFIISIWPVYIAIIGILYLIRVIRKRRKK